MNIYIAHSSSFDFHNLLYKPLLSSELAREHKFILPHIDTEQASEFVTRDIIPTCDLLIAEVSYPSTGLGIELGWADKASVPIYCIAQKDALVSSAISVVSSYVKKYDSTEELLRLVEDIVQEHSSYL